MKRIMEWAPFKLREGVAESDLIAASERLQRDFLAKQPGFISRTLVRAADGSYADIVWWASPDSAKDVIGKAGESQACAAYFALMSGFHGDPGEGVAHFDAIAEYAAER
jgi:hypothetical protein